MTTVFAPLEDIGAGEFKRATEVTYLGCVYGTMAGLRHMRRTANVDTERAEDASASSPS